MSSRTVQTVFLGQWRKIRWVILWTMVGIAVGYTLLSMVDGRGLRPNAGDPAEDFLVALLMIMVPCVVAAGSLLLVHSDAERLEVALPGRVLRLPLSTWKIVAVHFGFGALCAGFVALAATIPAFFFLNVEFGWWLPVLTAMAAMAFLQLWAAAFGNATPRVALLSFALCFSGLAWLAQRPVLVRLATESGPVMSLLLLALQFAAICGLAWWVVGVQRAGGWSSRIPLLNLPMRGGVRKRRPFATRQRAQFWYEWKLFGMLLPVYVLGVGLAYFMGLPLMVAVFRISDTTGNSSSEGIEALFSISWFTSAQFMTTGLTLAAFIGGLMVGGVMFMRAGHWNSQSTYLLTRPLSSRRITSARVWMALASTTLTLGLMIAVMLGLTAVLSALGETMNLTGFVHQGYEHLPAMFPLAAFWAFLFVVMWMGAWSVNLAWVLGVAAVVYIPPLIATWAMTLFGGLTLADAHLLSLTILGVCNWILSALLILGLLYMAFKSDRLGIVHATYPWVAAALWFIYCGAFYYYIQEWDIPPNAKEWAIRFPHPVNWSIWLGVSALPITPLFLQPLLLENARYR